MTVFEAIQQRKSIRNYLSEPVEKEKLNQVLEAGRLAPSARNQQNWHFFAITDSLTRQKLSDACCGQRQVAQAPVALVICATQPIREMNCGHPAETIDCSIALSFMILEAAELGLGTCWLGAFHADEVKKVLDLPQSYTVIAVSPLGYPAQIPNPQPRKSKEEVITIAPR